MSELLPCPFCGSKVEQEIEDFDEGVLSFSCTNYAECGMHTLFINHERISPAKDAEVWNRRATMDWISVKDRLPDCNQELIVTNGEISICARYDAKYNQFVQGHMDLTKHTTHWMPLPQPPKED